MFIVSGSGNKKALFERAKAEDGIIVCADPIELRETAYDYYGITGLNIISYDEFYSCKIAKYDKPIYINDINLTRNDIQIIGKNADTVKFEKFGITYIQFHAKQLIEDLAKYDDIKMEIIGRANINEWMGNITPQIFIEGYEVSDGSLSF